MKRLRRFIFWCSLLFVLVLSGLFVTKFDPTNPTLRRYSSEGVRTSGTAGSIGRSGENALANDLRLAHNEDTKPIYYVCNTKYQQQNPPNGGKCLNFSEEIENYRIPDFVSDNYIAESKNVLALLVTHRRDYQQIQEIAVASIAINRPLWIYVRVDTKVDDEYTEIARKTGGGVVYYFAVKDYADRLDNLLLTCMALLILVMTATIFLDTVDRVKAFQLPTFRRPKSPVAVPEHKASKRARKSVDASESFLRDTYDNTRNTLDD